MFTIDIKESRQNKATIEAIKPEIFELMVRFIYFGECPKNNLEDCILLYEAAHYYEIDGLKTFCEASILENLTIVNALEIYAWTRSCEINQMMAAAWKIIKR